MQRAVAVPLFVNGRSWNRPWRERGPAVPFARPPVKEPVPHGHQSRTRSPVKGGARRGTKDVVAAFRARQPSCSRAHHVCRASRRRRCGRARRQQKQASQYDTRCSCTSMQGRKAKRKGRHTSCLEGRANKLGGPGSLLEIIERYRFEEGAYAQSEITDSQYRGARSYAPPNQERNSSSVLFSFSLFAILEITKLWNNGT